MRQRNNKKPKEYFNATKLISNLQVLGGLFLLYRIFHIGADWMLDHFPLW